MSEAKRPEPSREKVRAHRERLRQLGMRPVQIRVPDVRSSVFRAESHRQSALVAGSWYQSEDQDFVDTVSDRTNA